jgi:CDP-glucose 4,6-dehydratase
MIDFWKDKRVFITGHTGFKGAWLCRSLSLLGARVTGYALLPPTSPSLFEISGLEGRITSIIADIRDFERLKAAFAETGPEIVFHMAAQPLVREGYKNPVETYDINIMGTVNILECLRLTDSVRSFINVTTDKVYHNQEHGRPFAEDDELGGNDPYSNSKACSEHITRTYKASYFSGRRPAITTARSGNVIGGGDFAADRIVPDCIKAALADQSILIRNPFSVRPYQHVLEALSGYLKIAQAQYENIDLAGSYNIGPREDNCVTTATLVDTFCSLWGEGARWNHEADDGPPEANFLKLNCSKIQKVLNWEPKWSIKEALKKTVEWTKVYAAKGNIQQEMDRQISGFYEP